MIFHLQEFYLHQRHAGNSGRDGGGGCSNNGIIFLIFLKPSTGSKNGLKYDLFFVHIFFMYWCLKWLTYFWTRNNRVTWWTVAERLRFHRRNVWDIWSFLDIIFQQFFAKAVEWWVSRARNWRLDDITFMMLAGGGGSYNHVCKKYGHI